MRVILDHRPRTPTPARGNDRLSDKKVGESGAANETKKSGGPNPSGKPRGKRGADIGRALRSVYDETLREDVPDDFRDLLGKLS